MCYFTFGFAQSNIGMVQIAEKVSLDGITMGPTLAALREDGELDEGRLALLNTFALALLRWQIPTNDISGRNIVLGQRNGHEMFLAVDGFGDIHAIPSRTYSKWIRRHFLAQRFTKVADRLSLDFDPKAFAFRLA